MQPACESSRPPIISFSRYRSSLVLRIPDLWQEKIADIMPIVTREFLTKFWGVP